VSTVSERYIICGHRVDFVRDRGELYAYVEKVPTLGKARVDLGDISIVTGVHTVRGFLLGFKAALRVNLDAIEAHQETEQSMAEVAGLLMPGAKPAEG